MPTPPPIPAIGQSRWADTLNTYLTWLNGNTIWSGSTAGGDLSGTYPSPSVAAINGTSVPAAPAAGLALVASSGTSAAWKAPFPLPAPAVGDGHGNVGTGNISSGVAMGNGAAIFSMILVTVTATYDTISCNVVSAGSTGSVVRMGLFKSDAANNRPGTLLSDAGTVSSTTTGVKTANFGTAQTLTPGLYFAVAVTQGAPTTDPQLSYQAMNTNGAGLYTVGNVSALATGNAYAFGLAGVTGALASNPTVGPNYGYMPTIALHRSA